MEVMGAALEVKGPALEVKGAVLEVNGAPSCEAVTPGEGGPELGVFSEMKRWCGVGWVRREGL